MSHPTGYFARTKTPEEASLGSQLPEGAETDSVLGKLMKNFHVWENDLCHHIRVFLIIITNYVCLFLLQLLYMHHISIDDIHYHCQHHHVVHGEGLGNPPSLAWSGRSGRPTTDVAA